MNDFLDKVILDNTVRSYLVVAGVILLTILFKRYLSRYIAGLIFKLVKRVAKGIDKSSFVRLVVSPLETFLLLVVAIVSIDKLRFPELLNVRIYRIHLHEFIDAVSVIVLIVTFIWLLLRMIDFIAMILNQKAEMPADVSDNQLVVFFKDLFKVLFVIMGILMILKLAFHYKISNLITALSIGSAAIALSFRESLENLIASFVIFFDKPFIVGDIVKVHDVTGTVEKIGLRSTRIRTEQKTFVTVPNKQMVDSIMDNLSLRTQRRALVQVELHGETPKELVDQFVQRVRGIVAQRKDIENSTIFLADIIKNAFVVHIEFFCAPIPIAEFNNIRQEVNLAVIELMNDMGLRLAAKEAEMLK
jgi:MscS family membrane protein